MSTTQLLTFQSHTQNTIITAFSVLLTLSPLHHNNPYTTTIKLTHNLSTNHNNHNDHHPTPIPQQSQQPQRLPEAEWRVIDDCGHSAKEVGTRSALIQSADKYKHL